MNCRSLKPLVFKLGSPFYAALRSRLSGFADIRTLVVLYDKSVGFAHLSAAFREISARPADTPNRETEIRG